MSSALTDIGPPLRVLHSLAPPDGTTKYVNQMVEGAPDDVYVRCFSWRYALRGEYDVLHLHWPELLLRAPTRRERFAKRQAMRMLLGRLRRKHIPLVRTVHNVEPHETGSAAERRLLHEIDRQTDLFIRLNPTTPVEPAAKAVTIPHGHYRDRFSGYPRSAMQQGRLLYFGIIRPYKGVERLIEVYRAVPRPDVDLRIVGKPSPQLRAEVEAAVSSHPQITARLSFVDDDVLVAEITAAELVVLPYSEMHNSGVALVALSLERPVLVPRSPAGTALAEEVGPGWVIQYDGEFDDAALQLGLRMVRSAVDRQAPRLAGREWQTIGREHRAAYRSVGAGRGGR
jgi:beta-1,4-mannosyltransferase